jgi:hypothetical protein
MNKLHYTTSIASIVNEVASLSNINEIERVETEKQPKTWQQK